MYFDASVPCREYAKVVGAGISNFALSDVVEMYDNLTSNNVNGQDHTFEVRLRDPAGNLSVRRLRLLLPMMVMLGRIQLEKDKFDV